MTGRDDNAWRLPIGETLDEARAQAILARFGWEARQVGQVLADRLKDEHPERQVDGRVFGVRTLLHAYQHPRDVASPGITLGIVTQELSSSGLRAIAIMLEWDTGRVVVRG
jgi:hypothetical protein